jgi:hypothetical protein
VDTVHRPQKLHVLHADTTVEAMDVIAATAATNLTLTRPIHLQETAEAAVAAAVSAAAQSHAGRVPVRL